MSGKVQNKKPDECGARITAVIFDLGDTLLNYGKVNINRLFRNGARLTYEYLSGLGQPVGGFKSYCYRNLFAIRSRYLWSVISGNDFSAREVLEKVNGKKGISLSDEQWDRLVWLWYEPLSRCAKVEPDIKETLGSLRDMGLKLGILSNTFVNNTALERHMRHFGILDFFSVRLFSYQFRFRKPNKKIFQMAARRIDEPVENIMFVGDRIDKDVQPALKVGMTAVLKQAHTNHTKRLPARAYKVQHISELPELIKTINQSARIN